MTDLRPPTARPVTMPSNRQMAQLLISVSVLALTQPMILISVSTVILSAMAVEVPPIEIAYLARS